MNQYIVQDLGSFFDIKKIFWHPDFINDYLRLFGISDGTEVKGIVEAFANIIKIYIHCEPDIQKIEQLPMKLQEDILDFKIPRASHVNGGGIFRMVGFLLREWKSLKLRDIEDKHPYLNISESY